MDVEKLTTYPPRDLGSWVDPARPILSTAYHADGPHRVAGHRHSRAQIIYPLDGVYRVTTPLGNWVVPPGQAIWIPSHLHHEVYSGCSLDSIHIFVDEHQAQALPRQCMVIGVSALLRELFHRAVLLGNDYLPHGRESRFFDVLLDEITAMEPASLYLPLARDKRLRRIMDGLLDDPSDARNLEALASQSGASVRTLERLFHREVGMSFSEWRTTLRLHEAIDRLGQGRSVTEVAMGLGYRSDSAFIAMFRRRLGVTPGHYFGG